MKSKFRISLETLLVLKEHDANAHQALARFLAIRSSNRKGARCFWDLFSETGSEFTVEPIV